MRQRATNAHPAQHHRYGNVRIRPSNRREGTQRRAHAQGQRPRPSGSAAQRVNRGRAARVSVLVSPGQQGGEERRTGGRLSQGVLSRDRTRTRRRGERPKIGIGRLGVELVRVCDGVPRRRAGGFAVQGDRCGEGAADEPLAGRAAARLAGARPGLPAGVRGAQSAAVAEPHRPPTAARRSPGAG
jgi:hypothetical protein